VQMHALLAGSVRGHEFTEACRELYAAQMLLILSRDNRCCREKTATEESASSRKDAAASNDLGRPSVLRSRNS